MGTTTEIVKSNVGQIQSLLQDSLDRIASVLPAHIKADRMISVAMELVSGDSKLCLCEPLSILKGVMEASQLGLLLNKHLGHAYLVPFKNGMLTAKNKRDTYDANFLIGYRGFINMVRVSNPAVTNIYSRIVYSGEHFELLEVTQHQLVHVPGLSSRPIKDMIGAYAVVLFKDGTQADFEYMPKDEIEKIHKSSKAQGPDSPWSTWPEEMIKKTPLRRLCKRLKLSPDMIEATVRDEYRELGYDGERPQPRTIQMPRRASEPAPEPEAQEPPQAAAQGHPEPEPDKKADEQKPPATETENGKTKQVIGTLEKAEVVTPKDTNKKKFMVVLVNGFPEKITTFNQEWFESLPKQVGTRLAFDIVNSGKYWNLSDWFLATE